MKGRSRTSKKPPSRGAPPPVKPGGQGRSSGSRRAAPQGLHVAARVVLAFGIFLCPVVIDPGTADPFNLVKITVLWTFVVVSGGLWLAHKIRTGERVLPSVLGSLGLIVVAVNLAATFLSRNPALSAIGIYKRYGGLASTALYVLVLWLLIDLYRDHQERLRGIVQAVAWAGIVVGVYVLFQHVGLDPIEWVRNPGASLIRPISTLGNSQFAGDYLGMSVPAFVYLLITASAPDPRKARHRVRAQLTSRRGLVALGLVMVLVALWITSSRSGLLAALVGALAMMIVSRQRFPGWAKATGAGLLIVGALVSVLVLWHPGSERPPGPFRDVQILRAESVGYRLYWWGAGARMMLDNPILGTGPETYGENLPSYRSEEAGAELGLWLADKPHNIFLEHGVGAGFLGLGSYLLLVGAALLWAWRRASGLDPPQRLLLATFVGTLVGYLAQGMFSIDVPPLALVGWVSLGAIGALADPMVVAAEAEEEASRPREGHGREVSPGKQFVAGGLVVVVVVGLIVVGTRPLRADQQVKEARGLQSQGETPGQVIDHFARAFALHPYEPVHRSELGDYFEELGDGASSKETRAAHFSRAIRFYERAHELQPGNVYLLRPIPRLHIRIARAGQPEHWEEAARWWQRIVDLDPNDWQAHAGYGRMLMAWADATDTTEPLCRAVDRFRRAAEIKPEGVQPWMQLANAHLSLRHADEARDALGQVLELDPDHERANRVLSSFEGLEFSEPVACP